MKKSYIHIIHEPNYPIPNYVNEHDCFNKWIYFLVSWHFIRLLELHFVFHDFQRLDFLKDI